MGEIVACSFGWMTKGEEVVIKHDFERREVDGEVIALNTDRRMRCLCYKVLAGNELRNAILAYIVADCLRNGRGQVLNSQFRLIEVLIFRGYFRFV